MTAELYMNMYTDKICLHSITSWRRIIYRLLYTYTL